MTWDAVHLAAWASPIVTIVGAVVYLGRYVQRVDTSIGEIARVTKEIAGVATEIARVQTTQTYLQAAQTETLRLMAIEKTRVDSLEKRLDSWIEKSHGA